MAGWFQYLFIVAALVCLKILACVPPMHSLANYVASCIDSWVDLDFKFQRRFFDWSHILAMAAGMTADRGRKAYRGLEAPNVKLSFVDRSQCHLFNFLKSYRPLVVNLINCVDEPFWSEFKKFNELVKRMSWMADFVTVVVGCGVAGSHTDWECMLNQEPTSCMHHNFHLQEKYDSHYLPQNSPFVAPAHENIPEVPPQFPLWKKAFKYGLYDSPSSSWESGVSERDIDLSQIPGRSILKSKHDTEIQNSNQLKEPETHSEDTKESEKPTENAAQDSKPGNSHTQSGEKSNNDDLEQRVEENNQSINHLELRVKENRLLSLLKRPSAGRGSFSFKFPGSKSFQATPSY